MTGMAAAFPHRSRRSLPWKGEGMPYDWSHRDASGAILTLWPNRSLSRHGFVWFIGLTAALISLPLVALIGSPVLWGLLPFLVLTVAGLWWALRRNYRDGHLWERLTLSKDRIDLVRQHPDGHKQDWSADPHWVQVELHETGGPVEKYLTLRGGGREVELGAFLSPEERVALRTELTDALARLR
jgi:uncharacterized membrane protein